MGRVYDKGIEIQYALSFVCLEFWVKCECGPTFTSCVGNMPKQDMIRSFYEDIHRVDVGQV